VDNDAFAVRYFVSQGFELFCSQSFAKNFGLYDTRTGALSVVAADAGKAAAVASQLEILVRASYSNPPSHGARVRPSTLPLFQCGILSWIALMLLRALPFAAVFCACMRCSDRCHDSQRQGADCRVEGGAQGHVGPHQPVPPHAL
jgi:hypothetical protein